jgi:hypothetical protein
MFKRISALAVLVLGAALLVYSASRSLDFIGLTLPPDRQILAWFALLALDGGLIAWLLIYLNAARGGWQRGIALVMVAVDLLGCVMMFTADTLLSTGRAGITQAMSANQIQTIVLALSAIIALNIAAAVVYHLTDPQKLREQAEEEAFGRVEDATLKQIAQNAEQLAAQVAPMLAEDWMQNTRARYLAALGTGKMPALTIGKEQPPDPLAVVALASAQDRANGHHGEGV